MKERLKNFKKFMLVYLLTLAAGAMVIASLTSCDRSHFTSETPRPTKSDSVKIAKQIEAFVNPQFYSVEEMTDFYLRERKGTHIDSVFRVIPDHLKRVVCAVVLNKHDVATKATIVEEWEANRNVYTNLPPGGQQTTKKDVDPVVDDDLNPAKIPKIGDTLETALSYDTDTIDGVVVRVQNKTIKTIAR